MVWGFVSWRWVELPCRLKHGGLGVCHLRVGGGVGVCQLRLGVTASDGETGRVTTVFVVIAAVTTLGTNMLEDIIILHA